MRMRIKEQLRLRCPRASDCAHFAQADWFGEPADGETTLKRLRQLIAEHDAGGHGERKTEDEGAPILGMNLNSDYEVRTAKGWEKVPEFTREQVLREYGQLPFISELYYIARKAPKPDPIQERREGFAAIARSEYEKCGGNYAEAFKRTAERIADGEAD